ncbi:MAG: cytochrome c-type biogenesis CcmF C-terminal domain-containing protein, partial [Thalassolituus sp.]
GVFILALLGICVGGSLLLYAIKAPTVASVGRYEVVSRETFLLLNNLVLVVMALAVLTGTLYPLVYDFMGLGKLSVGAAWFNTMFVPLTVILAVLMGLGAASRWKKDTLPRLAGVTAVAALVAIVFAVVTPFIVQGEWQGKVVLGLGVAAWLVAATLADIWKKSHGKLAKISKLGMSYLGMVLAHIGVAITIVGVTMVSNYSIEKSVRMSPGDVETLGDYQFEFTQSGKIEGPNYTSQAVRFNVIQDGEVIEQLTPEKRHYSARNSIMTEAAIDVTLFRDIYVSMGEPLENGAWGMRLQVKPFMRWTWLGAIFMALGGFLAMLDKRYRRRVGVAQA